MTELRTRKPTGKAAWPLILLEGEEKAGKSFGALALSASPLVHRTFVFDLGDGTADEYAALGPYEVVDLTGTYSDLVEQVRAAIAIPGGPNGEPNVYIIDSGTDLWDLLKDWASARARRSKKAREALKADPDADIDVAMNLWNDAKDRWATVVNLLRRSGGIGVITAQGSEVTKIENGQPTRDTVWSVNAEKTLPAAATCWVRVHRDPRRATLIGTRRLGLEIPEGGLALPTAGTLHHLVFEVIGSGASFAAPSVKPTTLGLTHNQAKRRLLDRITASWPALSPDECMEEARTIWSQSGLDAVEDIDGGQLAMLLDAVGTPEEASDVERPTEEPSSDAPEDALPDSAGSPGQEPASEHLQAPDGESSTEPVSEAPAPTEPEEPCPHDPDGLHHVGCGCDYVNPDDPARELLADLADEMVDRIPVPEAVELPVLTEDHINGLRKIELVEALATRGCPTNGRVSDLADRLIEHERARAEQPELERVPVEDGEHEGGRTVG